MDNIPVTKSIALDMTPGRKYMSAILFEQGITHNSNKVKRIYYQNLEDLSFMYEYYCMTPIAIQSLHNLLDLEHSATQMSNSNIIPQYHHAIEFLYESELISLLNYIYIANEKNICFKINMYDLTLFKFDFSNSDISLTNIVSKVDFNRRRKIIIDNISSKDVESELPTYNDVLDSFLMAGIYNEGQEQLFTNIVEEAETYIPKPKSYTISLDTNCLIFNIPNGLKNQLDKKNKIRQFKNLPLIPIGYFIAPKVKDELLYRSNKKLSTDVINLLKSQLHISDIFNQLTLKARKFQLGSIVLNRIRNYEIYSDNIQKSKKPQNDSAIIEEISNYEKYNKSMVKLLSNDNSMVSSAKTEGIDSIRIERNYDLESEYKISWRQFIDLLYHLSIIFIDITINISEPVKINGVWTGKSNNHWENQQIKIETKSKDLQNQVYEYVMPVRKFNE